MRGTPVEILLSRRPALPHCAHSRSTPLFHSLQLLLSLHTLLLYTFLSLYISISFFTDIVALLCNNTGIPHLEFDMADEEHQAEKPNHLMTLNLYPAQAIVSKAYADIVQNLGWRKFTIVYDEEDRE